MAGPRFSSQAINDLIFWGIHLCVVSIALGIVWTRLDATANVMARLVNLQNEELVLVKKQTENAEAQTRLVEQREQKRTEAVNLIMSQQKQIVDNVLASLEQIKLISKAVVGTAMEKEAQTKEAETVAVAAKGAARAASGALAAKKRALSRASRVIAKEKKKNFVERMLKPIGQ